MITIEFLRQFRIGGYALFDLAMAFLGMLVLSPVLSKLFLKLKVKIPRKNWLFLTLPISILAHVLVGNMTLMTKNFLDVNSHYVLKILIICLMILGVKDIKRISKK